MNIKSEFKAVMASKYQSVVFADSELFNKINVVKVLGAKKGCFVVNFSYTTDKSKYFYAELWTSSRVKTPITRVYRTESERSDDVKRFIENQRKAEQMKAERRKPQERGLEVGDILSAVWGYDQTNYNYYEVTKLIGKTMVEVREVSQMTNESGYMQGECAPVSGNYIGDPMRRTAKNGAVKICDVIRASKMDYKEVAGTRLYKAGHYTSYC